MSSLTKEVRAVQNVALGSTLIWRFVVGHSKASNTSAAPTLPLAFVVLPIVLHEDTMNLIASTRTDSGLHAFADKFSWSENQRADLLLSIHSRVVTMRELSWKSLTLAVERRLVAIATSRAEIISLSQATPAGVPASIKPLLGGAEKLGAWCSRLSLLEVCSVLKVQL